MVYHQTLLMALDPIANCFCLLDRTWFHFEFVQLAPCGAGVTLPRAHQMRWMAAKTVGPKNHPPFEDLVLGLGHLL